MCQNDPVTQSSNRSDQGAFALRPAVARVRRAGFIRVCLLLALLAAFLPASLAAAQAPEDSPAETAASPQAAIWSPYPIHGGNMEALISDPNNPQVFYLGTESAGVFKTVDAGANWQPARGGLPPAAKVISLAIDPQNSNKLYAGTEKVGTGSAGVIWRSGDAGATWTDITGNMETGTFADAYQPFNIIVDPHNSSIIYVGLGGYAGQIYKTTDGGATWWVMDAGIPRDRETYTGVVTALAIDPDNSLILYAGVRDYGVYKTIDGGATWTPLNEGVPSYREEYKGATALAVDVLHDNRPAGIIDGDYYVFGAGNTWSLVGEDVAITSDHSHLYFHPTDPNTIYSAGSVIKKSSDGGVEWDTVSSGSGPYRDLAFHLSAPNALLAANQLGWGGNTGGVRKSLNGGLNWIDASKGITAQAIQGVAIDPQNPSYLYAGLSAGSYSGVWRTSDRGAVWQFVATDGWVSDIAVDPLDSQRIYVAAMYILVSTDRGATYQKALEGFYDPGATCLAVTPGASNPVYAGGWDGVYKTIDSGLTWEPKHTTFPTNSSGDPAQVMSLAVDPNNTSIVWAGTEREGLVRSPDGGETWQYKGFLDMPDVDAVAVRPGDSNTILVGTGDYRGSGGRTGGIYKSTDGGQTWQRKHLGASTVTDFVFDPRNPDWVYAGTGYLPNISPQEGGTGVLRSVDGGEHWFVYSSGLFNQVVFSLAISSEASPLLLAGTMGSGLYGAHPGEPPPVRRTYLPLVVR